MFSCQVLNYHETAASAQREAFGSRVVITAKEANNKSKDFASVETQKKPKLFCLFSLCPFFCYLFQAFIYVKCLILSYATHYPYESKPQSSYQRSVSSRQKLSTPSPFARYRLVKSYKCLVC